MKLDLSSRVSRCSTRATNFASPEGRRSAERHTVHSAQQQMLPFFVLRGSAPYRGALAFRRSAAALARANASALAQLQFPRFLRPDLDGRYPSICLESTELLGDRSSCRPSGGPEPPGNGLRDRAQAPHSLRI